MFRIDVILAALLVTVVALLVIPIPTYLIDFFLSINLTFSIILLMASVYIKSPTQFVTLPSVILIGTAFRIAMSVATTRLILTEADGGSIIETFGNFVVAGSIAVGIVIFLIISVVQFIVVTKGAERVAEVSARFALDAMPGKQLSIDADLRAGAITQEAASAKRAQLDKQSQYLGAMDGAMKFVKGDAIASIVIMFVNILGGYIIGTAIHGMSSSDALQTYSILTIGDGLVAQIPSLLMAVSAGIIITRITNSNASDLGSEIASELTNDTRIPMMASPFIFAAGFIPGFPSLIFCTLGAGIFFAALITKRKREAAIIAENDNDEQPNAVPMHSLATNRFIVYCSGEFASDEFVQATKHRRNQLCDELRSQIGFDLLNYAILADKEEETGIRVMFDEVEIFSDYSVPSEHVFTQANEEILDGMNVTSIQNLSSKWPGNDGYWVPHSQAQKIISEDAVQFIDQPEIFAEAGFDLYEIHLATIISRNEVNEFLLQSEEEYPSSVEKIRESLPPAALVDLFRLIIKDGIPFRPKALFLNSLEEFLEKTTETNELIAMLRKAMKRQIVSRICEKGNVLPAIIFDQGVNQRLQFSSDGTSEMPQDPDVFINIIEQLNELRRDVKINSTPAMIVAPEARLQISKLLESQDLPFPVFGFDEIPPEVTIQPILTMTLSGDQEPVHNFADEVA